MNLLDYARPREPEADDAKRYDLCWPIVVANAVTLSVGLTISLFIAVDRNNQDGRLVLSIVSVVGVLLQLAFTGMTLMFDRKSWMLAAGVLALHVINLILLRNL